MEDTTLKQLTMVSRLPKFSSRATPAAAAPLTNGSTHPVSSGLVKGGPVGKQNGPVRFPLTVSVKGRKERLDCGDKVPESGEEVQVVLRSQQQPRSAVTARQIKKPSSAPLGKTSRLILTVPGAIPRTVTQPIKTISRNTVSKPPSPTQTLCSNLGVNAVSSSRGSCLSPQSLQSSFSQSSDSIKSLSVENVVRSQSFSYLKRPTAAINSPLTRSFSFNRATELAKELPRPLAQSPIARSPVTQASMQLDHVAKPAISACSISSVPPSTLKKSLLPNCTDGKPSSLSYKLIRPSFIKQPRPLMPVKVQEKLEFTERGGEKAISEPSIPSNGTSPEEGHENRGQSLEMLDDMSLSSTSSLERNDVSEEYMDDFDDLGNGGGILLMPLHEEKNDQVRFLKEESSDAGQETGLSETVDWTEIGHTGSDNVCGATPGCMTGVDFLLGSSLELSPSDSSGGTYLWDEEVLEPIGRVTHLCGSFDSNLNSIDILNNLENLDSGDLEDDDLMLDVDLPEDISLHSNSEISSYDHSDSNYWVWRKRQLCRGNNEQRHYDQRDLQPCDNDQTLGFSRTETGHSTVDQLILKYMVQDCSSVKEQLIQLRTLLQMEEDGSVDEVEPIEFSPSSEEPSYQQVDELLKEVQKLKEELQEKDVVISKLTQQLQSAPVAVKPCVCQQGAVHRPEHQDKSTQTAWRAKTPQILQPRQPAASEHRQLARPSLRPLSEVPSDHADARPGDGLVKPRSCAVVLPSSNATLPSALPTTAPALCAASASISSSTLNSDKLIFLLNPHLRTNESPSPRTYVSNHIQLSRKSQQSSDLHTLSTGSKAPVLMKPAGAEQDGLARGGPSRTRHLPPPSRGLPAINSASQSSLTPSTHCSRIRTISALKDQEISSVNAQDLSSISNSRLPKPKSH